MSRRRVVAGLFLTIGLVTGVSAVPSGADLVSNPYNAIGTVNNPHATFDGGSPVAGEIDAFSLNPVEFAGTFAQPCIDAATGDLTIYVTPGTAFYYKDPATQAYARSTYETVIAAGQNVRVVGRAYARTDNTTRCVATLVYNPPNTPRSGGYNVKCGENTDVRVNGFTVLASVQSKNIHWPCTKSPGDLLGVRLGEFAEAPTFAVSEAIDDFGARLEVHMSPAAKYVLGNQRTTYDRVVKAGRQLRVFGNYQYIGGAWLFLARSVFYPGVSCTDPVPETTECERQVAAYTPNVAQSPTSPGHYEGTITAGAPVFGGGTYQAELVWTAVTDELGRPQWSASGTWAITSVDQRASLNGTLTGFTSGASGISLSYDIDGGTGPFRDADGGGELEGQYSSGLASEGPPSGYAGNNRFIIVPSGS